MITFFGNHPSERYYDLILVTSASYPGTVDHELFIYHLSTAAENPWNFCTTEIQNHHISLVITDLDTSRGAFQFVTIDYMVLQRLFLRPSSKHKGAVRLLSSEIWTQVHLVDNILIPSADHSEKHSPKKLQNRYHPCILTLLHYDRCLFLMLLLLVTESFI